MTESGVRWGPLKPFERQTDEQKQAGIAKALAERPAGEPFRVFGFGSLMWNPEMHVAATCVATVHDYSRRFQIWSTRARGCPEAPGLGLCLVPEKGSACPGLILELDEDHLAEDLKRLWDREQGSGVYRPVWVDTEGLHQDMKALTFVVCEDHPHFVPPLPRDQMAEIMCKAAGRYGTNHDYLVRLLETMHELGIDDPDLRDLDACIRARLSMMP